MQNAFLLGSNKQPAVFSVAGVRTDLGTIVASAQAKSGLTVEAWNAVPDDEREMHIEIEIEALAAVPAEASTDEAEAAAKVETEAAAKVEAPEIRYRAKTRPMVDNSTGLRFTTDEAGVPSKLTNWLKCQIAAGYILRVTP